MIYVDFSSLTYACYFAQESEMGVVREEEFRRHVLNRLLWLQNKFKFQFGPLVLCCDGPRSWRYEVYPHYKALRKMTRAKDAVKWKDIDTLVRKLRDEFIEHNVFRVVMVPRAEGDDVIATLAANIKEPSVIVSEDKDFHQLHKYSHVHQYSHRRDVLYQTASPEHDLVLKIITGDRNDSIPNLHSKDDVFVLNEKQTMVSAKRKAHYAENFFVGEGGIPVEYARNFERNKKLIDFSFIPADLWKAIIEEFEKPREAQLFGSTYRTQYLMQAGINPNAL